MGPLHQPYSILMRLNSDTGCVSRRGRGRPQVHLSGTAAGVHCCIKINSQSTKFSLNTRSAEVELRLAIKKYFVKAFKSSRSVARTLTKTWRFSLKDTRKSLQVIYSPANSFANLPLCSHLTSDTLRLSCTIN